MMYDSLKAVKEGGWVNLIFYKLIISLGLFLMYLCV